MFKPLALALTFAMLLSAAAHAACPPAVPGDTPEAIHANGQRLICLQNEVAATARQREYELQVQQLTRSVQNLEIQRRLDALPKVPVYVPPAN